MKSHTNDCHIHEDGSCCDCGFLVYKPPLPALLESDEGREDCRRDSIEQASAKVLAPTNTNTGTP